MPLNDDLRQDLIDHGVYEEGEGSGYEVLAQLGVDPDSAFGDFCAHGTEASYIGAGGQEIDDIIWMAQNSGYLEGRESMLGALGLPADLLPLDAFEGGGGFFYSTANGGVYEIELGEKLQRVVAGDATPDWPNFEAFLSWFFFGREA
jgi:hypothetical protein